MSTETFLLVIYFKLRVFIKYKTKVGLKKNFSITIIKY